MLEREILGACLLDEKAVDKTLEQLTEHNFTGENREVFNAIKSLREEGKTTDVITVNSLFSNVAYLFGLTEEIGTTKLINQHIGMLKEQTIKNDLRNRLSEIVFNSGESSIQEIKEQLNTLDGQIETNSIETEIRDLDVIPYTGLENIYSKFIPTGLPTIDHDLDDLVGGLTTIVAGRNNGGKTTFVNQVIANAIDNGFKTLIVNGEEKQDVTINKIYKSVIGRNEEHYRALKLNKRYRTEPTPEALTALKKWHKGKLKVFSKGESNLKTTNQLFSLIKREIKKNNTDLVVMDNLMSLLTVSSDLEKNGKQAEFMQKCCDLAKEYNTHIMIVVHPNKTYQKGQELNSEQISGTSDLANKADNVITVVREYEQDAIDNGLNGSIQIQKNREFSELSKIDVHFEESTGLLLEIKDSQYMMYSFKWQQYLAPF